MLSSIYQKSLPLRNEPKTQEARIQISIGGHLKKKSKNNINETVFNFRFWF
jgi:hypothetical protein